MNLNEQLQREREAKFEMVKAPLSSSYILLFTFCFYHLKESQLEATRNELSLMMGRSDALYDELSETKRKLSQTSEAKHHMKEEIKVAEMRLMESRNQVVLRMYPHGRTKISSINCSFFRLRFWTD